MISIVDRQLDLTRLLYDCMYLHDQIIIVINYIHFVLKIAQYIATHERKQSVRLSIGALMDV